MTVTEKQTAQTHHRAGGLTAIGIFKLVKAAIFLAVGIGVLRLLHRDLADITLRLATALKFNAEGNFVNSLIDHVQRITPHRLRQISLASMVYAGVATVEGIGLLKEKVWAEYLTMILTASLLPFEIWEIAHQFTWTKVIVILINIAVLVYLILYVRNARKHVATKA
jgi:uncharacterized membrane protein (DUF2068 family)